MFIEKHYKIIFSKKMKYHKTLIFLTVFVWIIFSNETFYAQKRTVPPRRIGVAKSPKQTQLSPELQRRVETFQLVWQTIKNNYFDQTFSGLNWETIRKEYEPRVLKTKTDSQLHDILEEMINRLNRSHFAIITPEVYEAIEKTKADLRARVKAKETADADEEMPDEGEPEADDLVLDELGYRTFGIGVDLRLINNQFVITSIEKNSSAEYNNLKIGYVIQKVNDVSLDELLLKVDIYFANVKNIKRNLPDEIVNSVLNGEKDSEVSLTVLDETDKPKEVKLRRERLRGEQIVIRKNYPEQQLIYETETLNNEVGYIKFNLFALPIIEKFCNSLTELKDKKAIVIDLRGNSGGILATMIALSGMLTDKSIDLGTSIYNIGSENMIGASKAKNFKGRLVFLVDNHTVSAAEIFAAALQENNRALVVGEKTAGEALPSITIELPTGAVLLYPIANFKTRNGNFLEGKGVQPNFVVALDRKSLLAGKDNQLETALKLIREDKDFPKINALPMNIGSYGLPAPPPPPPPPAPKAIPKKVLAEVTVNAPPPPMKVEEKFIKDAKSLQVVAEFIAAIGGESALDKVNSYSLSGIVEIGVKGSKESWDFNSLRQKPDKYAEILNSPSGGEIREIYNGNKYFVQADYGINRELPTIADTANIEILSPLNNLVKKSYFKSLEHQGIFDRKGRKTHIVSAKTAEGANVAMAFDVETKTLVSYIGSYYGISFGDYRKVGDLMLPFSIERENVMTITLDDIKLNPVIEGGKFTKKENCFDRPN